MIGLLVRRRHGDGAEAEAEAGMAMLTAILVCTVVLFLGVTSVALGDHSFNSLRVDRKRVATFHAAEAGIDHALQVLQTTAQASLPCGTPLTGTLGSGPGSGDYSVTFSYFDAGGLALTCPLLTVPRSVLLASVGNSSDPLGSPRTVQVTAKLSPPTSTVAFDKVIFSEGNLVLTTHVWVQGYAGNDAIVYTNGNFTCTNTPVLQGYVYAQGSASISNFCAIDADIWSAGAVVLRGNGRVGRDLISGTSSVTIEDRGVVSRNARAGTTVTVTGPNAVVGGLRIPNSPIGAPPTSSFPQVPYVEADWVNAGYTIRPYTDCALAALELGTLSSTWATPTLLRISGCRLDIGTSTTINLASNLAIVSDQGMTFGQKTVFQEVSPTGKEVHFIVPYASLGSCSPTIGNISMREQFEVKPPTRVLAYTPCTLEIQNSGLLQGQFYGGTLDFKNNPSLKYVPVSGIPGYSPTLSSTLVRQVAVLYKREV